MVWPAHGEVIRSKIRLIAQVGIPAFARADEEHTVACVFDDIAAVMKLNRKLLALLRRLRKYDMEIVLASDAALLEIHPLVLKIGQGLALGVRNGFGVKCAGKLERKNALTGSFGTKMNGGCGIEGIVRLDRGVKGVVECAEIDWWRNRAGDTVGRPDIVVHEVIGFSPLAQKELLAPL